MAKQQSLDFNSYQEQAKETAVFPYAYFNDVINGGHVVARQLQAVYPVLGLTGEAGEVAEKVKKLIRDRNGVYDDAWVEELKKELGDVMWYVAIIADCFKIKLEDVATGNITKLRSRKERNKINGEGDNR